MMIDKNGLDQILHFVSKQWVEMSRDPDNAAMKNLPASFWMNSVGGKAGNGHWMTMLLYTESEEDAKALKEVLLRWQAKGRSTTTTPDLIQIKRK